MNNLTNFYNNSVLDDKDNLYLSFTVGENKYAINAHQVVEIMKLPHLEYPQQLPNNIVGLLNYNNFTINILDIRFYLNLKVTPYTLSNQLLVVKTDESFFGLLINKVEDIISIDESKIEHLSYLNDEKLIEFTYHTDSDTISVLNLYATESLLKAGVQLEPFDIQSLFPKDDESLYKLMQRNQALVEKSKSGLVKNTFAQDQFISFSLNNSIYCINLEYVKEFLKNSTVNSIPCTPDYIAGLITLRGDFVTVVDVKKFLGLSDCSAALNEKNNVIIIETQDYKIGFLVDEIYRIIDIPEELVLQNSHNQMNKNILSEVVMDDRLYKILNMKNVLSDERFFIEERV